MSIFSGVGAGLNISAARTTTPEGTGTIGGFLQNMFARPAAGIPVDRDVALTYGAVWAAVSKISEHIAMMPHRVYQGDASNRSVDNKHPVDHLLHRQANPETNSFDWCQSMFAHALLQGNGLSEIEWTNGGEPGAFWQIDWDRVNPDRDSRGRLVYEIANGGAANSHLYPKDVIHLKGFSLDGVTGLSIVSFAKQAISLGLAMEQYGAAFFGNGALPGGVIEWGDTAITPEGWGADAAKNMKKTWNKNHRGPAKNSGIEILEPGQKFKTISISPEDSQFLQSRKFGVTEIARWFGIPPHKMADLDRATNSNIEMQNTEYVIDCLMPWAVRFEKEINAKLLRGDNYSKVSFNSLLRGDLKTRQEFYKAMLDRGIYNINEVRALEDLNPVTGGDLRLVQMNMVSLEQAAKNGNTVQQKGENNV